MKKNMGTNIPKDIETVTYLTHKHEFVKQYAKRPSTNQDDEYIICPTCGVIQGHTFNL